ncbi:MAG: isochorismatase family protein, partial [Nitrososphaerales archaeon]
TCYAFHPKGLVLCPGMKWVPIGKGAADFPELFQRENIDPMIKPEYGKDVIIPKCFYGAFTATELDYVLKNIGADTVIICGTMTNYCCGATAREAFSHGYKVVFGSDVNATDDPELHEAELKTLRRGYALILTADEIIEALQGRGPYAAK